VTSSTGFCPEHEAIVDVSSRPRLATSGTHRLAVFALLFAPVLALADDLKLEDAIRRAWAANPGLSAASLQAQASRKQASSAEAGRLPNVALSARGVGTGEPMMAFGLRLDQQRIAAVDLSPDRLNAPPFTGGVGLGATLTQPIYAGGRITAGIRAARAQADADGRTLERRRDELALAVTEAYFGSLSAARGLAYADDVLAHARETERFVKDRNAKGVVLDADVARAAAFRAQAEADRATAEQRLASARSALALLSGEPARSAALVTPIEGAPAGPETGAALEARADLRAARARAEAAREMVGVERGNLLPQVFAQGSVETMRSAIDQGATWFTGVLVARWQLALGDVRASEAARLRASAGEAAARWQEQQARREVEEARRAVEAADARVRSAAEAVTASESARTLRDSRYRQGLLPLTDVLDADSALAGARALLVRSRFEARLARAALQLATGALLEGVKP
jgi:outer membrane protein TolC